MAKTPTDQLGFVDGNTLSAANLLQLTDASIQYGPTADRPTGARRYGGKVFYDTTIGAHIWWNATTSTWCRFGPGNYATVGSANSGVTSANILSGTLPAPGFAGQWQVTATLMVSISAGTTVFESGINDGTTTFGGMRNSSAFTGGDMLNLSHTCRLNASTGTTTTPIYVAVNRVSGSGTVTTYADNRYNRIDAIYFPT